MIGAWKTVKRLAWIAATFLVAVGAQGEPPPRLAGAPPVQREPLADQFDGEALDTATWLVAYRQWPFQDDNGGVVPENVALREGRLVLTTQGNQYKGPLRGITQERYDRPTGKRTGGAIATRKYFGSGRYEVRMKIAPVLGAVQAIWTFHYEDVDPKRADSAAKAAGRRQHIFNHEIDIELPGRPGVEAKDIGHDYALMNTFLGVNDNERTTGYTKLPASVADGAFHVYRFDWHTGGEGVEPRVEFYIDGKLLRTSTTHVPTRASRFWIGVWCPKDWAGEAAYDTAEMTVDWVRIAPFNEAGDEFVRESFSDDGWAPNGPGQRAPRRP